LIVEATFDDRGDAAFVPLPAILLQRLTTGASD
jgi:hypothetical protein